MLTRIKRVCVGHEIVGKAVRVGSKVGKGIKVGDRVGVGAQALSCLKGDCEECQNGMEQHCQHTVNTFASPYPDGQMSYGGYADYNRTNSHFVFKIPEEIPSEDAAPMLCGGITVYSPLKQNGCGPGKRVRLLFDSFLPLINNITNPPFPRSESSASAA